MREGLVLVGHGSRSPRSEQEMGALAHLVSTALGEVMVRVGYLEMSDPPAGTAIDSLVESGCDAITILPMVMFGAGHSKSDVPAVVLDARERHPGTEIRLGSPLGVSREPVALLGESIMDAGGRGLPLLVIARGTSDPDANADAHKAARLLAEWTGAPFVHVGFSGVTRPGVVESAEVFARLGYGRVALAWWYLCHGVLIDQGKRVLDEFASRSGIHFVDAGHVGPEPELVPLIASRYHDALHGHPVVNCDTCAYRAPWPGREGRVAQPRGVGHSALAAAHRHH